MKKWIYILTALACYLSGLEGLAQEPQFIARAGSNTYQLGEEVIVFFRANAEGSDFVPPANLTDDFYKLSGPYVSRNMSVIQGQTSMSLTWEYRLRAKKVGEFELERASIKINGERYYTEPVNIKIVENSNQPDDSNDPRVYASKRLYMRIIPSKLRVYVGEPLGVTYRLYGYDRPSGSLDFKETPNYDGFITEDVESRAQPRQDIDDDGNPFLTWDVASKALIPQRAGLFEFDPLVTLIPTPIPVETRDMWGRRTRGYQTYENLNTAYHPDIEVLPLPNENKPASFNGAVGEFEYEVTLSRGEVDVNESVTLTLQLKGKGNLNTIKLPEVELPDQLELFEPEDENSIIASPSGLRGELKREFVLVPRYKGTYKIPPMEFAYFDPDKEEYVTLQSEELIIEVSGEGPVVATSEGRPTPKPSSTDEKQEVEYLNKDIRWIQPVEENTGAPKAFYRSAWYFGGVGVSFLLTAYFLFAGSIRRWNNSRFDQLAAARKEADKAISKAGEWREARYALGQFLKAGFDAPFADQIDGKLQRILTQHGMSEADAQKAYDLLRQSEAAEYGATSTSLESWKVDAKSWIQNQTK
ncbi:MAG: protein BatD [Flavobacteriia bacterium]|nr:protein BatD [Flavobacteriia bacterium]